MWSKGLATEHLEDKARRPSKRNISVAISLTVAFEPDISTTEQVYVFVPRYYIVAGMDVNATILLAGTPHPAKTCW